jgi:hypothetical protein
VNIIEYKSPGDYLSVEDYHKAGAYVRLYGVLNRAEIADMTLTFVSESYPRKLLAYLGGTHGYQVEERWPGIYYVAGSEVGGTQIVETKRLREEDGGLWLRGLRRGLKGEELREILEESRGVPKEVSPRAYLWMVVGANEAKYKELLTMSSAFEKVMEECGLTAKWEARGREEGREEGRKEGLEEAVKRLQRHGMNPVEISRALDLPLATVIRYLETD